MRQLHLIFTLFAALMCTSKEATAQQNLSGMYHATLMNGLPVYQGLSIYIEVQLVKVDIDGTEHYETRARIFNDITGELVSEGQPGTIRIHPLFGVGVMVGSTGLTGEFSDLGGGQYQADYSASGGNTRLWNKM